MLSLNEFKYDDHIQVVYVIHHTETKKTFVGASDKPRVRVGKHYWMLQNGVHPCVSFQEAYDKSPKMYHVYYVVKEHEDQIKLRNALVELYRSEGRSFNNKSSSTDDDKILDLSLELAGLVDNDDTYWLGIPNVGNAEKITDAVVTTLKIPLVGLEGHTPTKDNIVFGSRIPGVYVIQDTIAGKCYIGSTSNLYGRILTHRANLRKNKHMNPNLQKAFNENRQYEVVCFETKTHDDAINLEQVSLDKNWGKGILFNSAPDARNSLALISYKGVKFSEERLRKLQTTVRRDGDAPTAKSVSINGVLYGSARGAARKLGMNFSTVQRYLNRQDGTRDTWFYTT